MSGSIRRPRYPRRTQALRRSLAGLGAAAAITGCGRSDVEVPPEANPLVSIPAKPDASSAAPDAGSPGPDAGDLMLGDVAIPEPDGGTQ